MEKVYYAKTNSKINRLGFGAWQLGNALWGDMNEQDGILLAKEAIKEGINFFDTAPGYGSGMSERILGIAIFGQRDKVVINTKLGHKANGHADFSVESLENQVLDSLKRIDITYLDSVILHNPSMAILEGKTPHFEVLNQIRQKGLIRAYGVSIDTFDELKAVLSHGKVDVVEILFNVFFQGALPLFKEAKEKGISLIAKVPLDSGWLTGKYDETSVFTGIRSRWDNKTISRRSALIKQIQDKVLEKDITKYAIAFILSFDEITAVIPGMKDLNQLHDHLSNVSLKLEPAIKTFFMDLYEKQIKDNPLSW